MRASDVLESHSAMMMLGLVTGLIVGGFPEMTKEISMGALALLMTISLTNVRLGDTGPKGLSRDALLMLLLNYGFLTALILVMGSFSTSMIKRDLSARERRLIVDETRCPILLVP